MSARSSLRRSLGARGLPEGHTRCEVGAISSILAYNTLIVCFSVYNERTTTSITIISAILRLSAKDNVQDLPSRTVSQLDDEFPSTWEQFNAGLALLLRSPPLLIRPVHEVPLADLVNIPQVFSIIRDDTQTLSTTSAPTWQ